VPLVHASSRPLGLALCVLFGAYAASAGAATVATSAAIAKPLPDFTLPAVAGSNVRLSEYLGQPVVLSFWSSRCSLCAAQLKALDRYYDTYRSSGLVVLGISVEDDPQRALDYAHAHKTSFPMLLDRGKIVSRALDIDRLPTTVLIDRGGTVRYLHGDDNPSDPSYVAQIRALLDDRLIAP
jgi:peroxiredoxin